jgi:hypothetical protein
MAMLRHQPGPRAEAHRGIEHRAVQNLRRRASQEMHQCGKLGRLDRAAPGQAGEESLQVFGCQLRQGAGLKHRGIGSTGADGKDITSP